jgi:dynein heavy chain, axonemal
LNVFYQGSKKSEWSSIPTENMEPFFRTVSLILADQIRHIVEESVKDFLLMLSGNVVLASKRTENGKPLTFLIKLALEDGKIKMDPSFQEVQITVETLFDMLLVAADRVPKIETQLFSNGTAAALPNRIGAINSKPDQCIKIAFETSLARFVEISRLSLKNSMNRLFEAPLHYISEFDKHRALINRSAELDLLEFLKTEPTHDRMAEVL